MLHSLLSIASAALAAATPAATATDCGTGMVCASNPAPLIDAMQKAGYRAELGKDGVGDPLINSNASGYKWSVMFYDCTDHKDCKSIQFQASFDSHDGITADYVNRWNSSKRFVRAALDDDRTFYLRYDLSTLGGLNQKNFADALDWWDLLLGDYSSFSSENLP